MRMYHSIRARTSTLIHGCTDIDCFIREPTPLQNSGGRLVAIGDVAGTVSLLELSDNLAGTCHLRHVYAYSYLHKHVYGLSACSEVNSEHAMWPRYHIKRFRREQSRARESNNYTHYRYLQRVHVR